MEAPKCPQPPPPQLARPSDIPCHDGAASSRDACDQQQQQQQCGSSQQAHSQLPPLPPPQQQRSRRISKAPSSLANAAAPVPSTLFCVTKAALTAFSDQRRFAIGMGLYERVVEGRPSTHTPLTGGFEVGPLVFCNDRLLRLHDDDEEVARWRVMTCIDSSAAFCRALQGLLKNVLRGDVNPVAVRRLYKLHVCPSTMAVTYLYPCSYHDGEVLHELAYLMVPVPQTIEKGLTENLMQDHIALKYAPAMMTTVDRWGRIVAQNSASFGALGFHGRDHRRLGHEQQRVHYLQELFATDVEAYETMLTMTSHSLGSTFKIVLQITSPTLLAWLGKQGEEVWHEIQVSTMPHPVYSELLFIASQTDVTPTIIVQRQLEQMQQMQKELLSEILPPQVSDKLLLTAENSGDDGGKDAFMTPEGHHLLQLLTARRSGVGEQLSQPSTPNAQDNNSSSNVNNNNNNNNSNDNSNSSTANGLGRTGSGSSSEAYAHALDYFDGDVAIRLTRRDVMSLATYHEEVTILFTDIVGFSAMSQQLHPSEIMLLLNNVYSVYDGLCEIYDVYKVETIGDSFMAAGGLFEGTSSRKHLGGRDPLHAVKVLSFARALVAATAFMRTPLGEPLNIRIGIHSGPCMSGVVGRKMPRFCLFGDSINMASRMESTGQAGMIHASQVTRDLLPHEPWAPTGGVYAKGMGTVQSYIWAGERMLTPTPPVSIAVRQQQNAADKAAAADSTTASAHRRYSLDARHTSATAAGAAGAAAAALSSQPPGCLLQSQVVPQRDGPEGRRPGPFTLSGSQLIL